MWIKRQIKGVAGHRRFRWIGLAAAMLILGTGPLRAEEPAISVYYPDGHNVINGAGRRSFVIAAPTYNFACNVAKSQVDEFYLPAGAKAGVNLFDAGGALNGISLMLTDGTGKIYYSVLDGGNDLVNSWYGYPIYQTSMYFAEGGKHFYRLEVKKIQFKSADGLVMAADGYLNCYVWLDRVFVDVTFTATQALTLSGMQILTVLNNDGFDHYCLPGGSATPIPSAGSFASPSLPSGIVFSDSRQPGAGSLAYIVGNPQGTKHLICSRGTYGLKTQPAIICRQVLFDSLLDGGSLTMNAGDSREAYFQLYPSADTTPQDGLTNIDVEIHPLTPTILDRMSGSQSQYLSYDSVTGCYAFNVAYLYNSAAGYRVGINTPNQYDGIKINLPADSRARSNRIRLRSMYQAGWIGGMVADELNWPSGEGVQCAEVGLTLGNPNTLYTYTVIPTQPAQAKTFWVKVLGKRWGETPAVYNSSENLQNTDPLGQLWLNVITGTSASDCLSVVQRAYASICDAGVLNGNIPAAARRFYQNAGGNEFLEYTTSGSSAQDLESRGVRFNRVSPSLLDLTFNGITRDKMIESTIDYRLPPISDLNRLFLHLRYDVKGTVQIQNLKRDLTLLTLADEKYCVYPNYQSCAYTDAGGNRQIISMQPSVGLPLGGPTPWACVYADPTGNRGLVLRSYTAKVNGAPNNQAAITLVTSPKRGLHLVPDSTATQLITGDYFDLEVEIVSYGTENSNYLETQNEAARYGSGRLSVDMKTGSLVSLYPPRIQLDPASGWAEFVLTGGRNFVPLEFMGLDAYTDATRKPFVLEESFNDCWVPYNPTVGVNDGWDVNLDRGTGQYSVIIPVYREDGFPRRFRAHLSRNRLDAEDYVAANDSTAGNAGGQYRSGDVDIYASPQGGYYVGNSAPGEWLEFNYTNPAAEPRLFTSVLNYQASSAASVHLSINGVDQPAIALGFAAGWQKVSGSDIKLKPSANRIRLTIDSGSPSLDYIQLMYERPLPTRPYDFAVLDHSLPIIIKSNETFPGWILVKNIGTAAWTGSDYRLRALDLFYGSWAEVAMDSNENIQPGQIKKFNITIDSPEIFGFSPTRWKMMKGSTSFPGEEFQREIQTAFPVDANATETWPSGGTQAPQPAPPSSAVEVIWPNGNEVWPIGSTQALRWRTNLETGGASIRYELWQDGAKVADLGSGSDLFGEKSDAITVPTVPPGSDYKVWMLSVANPSLWDESDAYFTIVEPTEQNQVRQGKWLLYE